MSLRAALLMIAVAGCSSCARGQAKDASPMFRGNLAHTGVYDAAGVPKFSKIKWKFKTGGRIISSPAVVDGTVYFGSFDENVYAIDAETGAQKWKFTPESAVSSSPAVAGGLVYFTGYDGKFYAVDAATGKQKWTFETEGERRFAGRHLHGMEPTGETMPDFWDFYLSSPAVFSGNVYFGSGDGNVYALDAASGALKWKFKTGNVVHASPAIADGTLFIGSWDSYFYALDPTTGKEKWHFKTGEDHDKNNHVGIQSSAAVMDGVVYFGCRDSHIYAVDEKTGKKIWDMYNGGGWVSDSPAVLNGVLYIGTGSDTSFHSLNAKTGEQLVSQKVKSATFASPAIAGNLLYVATFNDTLTAMDLKTQKPVWTFTTGDPAEEAAAKPPQNQLQTDFYDERAVGMQKRLATGVFLSSPVVVKDVVYIGSTDGYLYALM